MWMKLLLILAACAMLGLLAYIRLAGADPADWHVDPQAADDPGAGGVLLLPGPDRPVYPLPPGDLLRAFDRVAMAAPRTGRLAGSVEAGRVTYVVRSRWIGFPDYISVRAVPVPGGSQLAVYSRLRFGKGDMGVNARRLGLWLDQLEPRAQ